MSNQREKTFTSVDECSYSFLTISSTILLDMKYLKSAATLFTKHLGGTLKKDNRHSD